MVDRQDLRDKAKGVGSAVAGTFSKGAKAAKSAGKNVAKNTKKGAKRAKKNITGEQDVEVFYNQEAEKYLLYVDGEPVDQFDSEMQAKAAAREIQRGGDTGEEAGRFQQFATEFAEGVNQTVKNTADGSDTDADDDSEPRLAFMGESDGDSEPQLAFMGDPDDDGDPEFAFMGDMNNDGQPDMTLFESNQDASEPMLPGFGGGGGDENAPQLPGFGMSDDGDNAPFIPGFEPLGEEEEEKEPTYPWMF